MSQAKYETKTKVGTIYLVATENSLKSALFQKTSVPFISSFDLSKKEHEILAEAVLQLIEYLEEKRKTFSLQFGIDGTDFQWKF